MAKSRLREKELRRRRHRYRERKKQRIKQQIFKARLQKLEMKQKAAAGEVTSASDTVSGAPQTEPQPEETGES